MSNKNKKINFKKSLLGKPKLFFKGTVKKITRSIRERAFFQSKIVLMLLILGLLANIANWLILFIFIRPVDTDIILHYNVYFGVDTMGNWKQVFIMPVIGFILFIINAALAAYFYRNKERIASYVLLLTALMAQVSFIIASAGIILINI